MRPTANTILRRAIRSASDDSLQPYLLYAPQNRRDLPPLLYLHGAAATEEQLVGVHTGLILLADALGCPVIAPRAREGALCSAQAESDIHESLRDAEHALGRSWSQVIAVGTGRGAVLALQLAARAPHRISGCVLLPSDAFERNAAIAEPPRMADPMLANLRDLPVLILAGRGDPQADALELQLAAVEARVTRLETISETDPFAGGACRAALRQMLRRAPPHAFTFTTTRAAWRDAWWIRIGRMAGSGPARVEGRIANDGNIAIETEGLHSLEVIPSRLPLSPDTPVSITWNGDTVFSGPLSGTLSVALGPAAPSARREPLRADALLDEIMRAPHAAVVPDDPDWHGAAARVLARAHARARYGRDAGMWSDPILTPDQVDPRSPEHLILFGGPEDNPLVAARSGALPVRFTPDALIAGDTAFALASHTVICAGVDPLDPARLIAVVAGDALGRWIPLCAGTAMNPFAAPERFPGVIVWRMHDDQEAFSEVWRTAPADPAPPPQ